MSGISRGIPGHCLHFGLLDLGIVNFDDPPGLDGSIGDDFFARNRVCMDFPGKRVLIRDDGMGGASRQR